MELVDALDRTFTHAEEVVAGVRPEQYDDATPCTDWNVRELLTHLIAVVDGLGAAVSGRTAEPFTLAEDPAAQLHDIAAQAMVGWRSPGALDRVVDGGPGPMPGRALAGINLLDTAAHTWDLAVATGQPATLSDDVASAALEASHQIVDDALRPGRFDPEVTVSANATPTDALVAFLGRVP